MDDETDSDGNPTNFTWLQYADGQGCECVKCDKSNAVDEFFAYCPECWKDLTPAERAVLRGEESPVEKIVHHTTMLPGWTIAQWFYNVVCGVAVAFLYWRIRHG